MKHLHILFPVLALAAPILAAQPITVAWNQVCQTAQSHELLLTTTTGDAVEGTCIRTDVNGISVTTIDHRVVTIARTALARIDMRGRKGHQLESLGHNMRDRLRWGFDALLSPQAPVGALVIPITLAWGAASAPFCLLGDLVAKGSGLREIKAN